jgi:gliding motility-associated protein GldM
MAGGKETPRQKMIGMMYLVLTALLALNVSKAILDAFVAIEENIQISNLNEYGRGEEKKADLKAVSEDRSAPDMQTRAANLMKVARKIDEMTAERIRLIDEIKLEILEKCGEPIERTGEDAIITKAYDPNEPLRPARMDLMKVDGKDKYDEPMDVMGIAGDIKNPGGMGLKLWKSYNGYRKALTELLAKSSSTREKKYAFKDPKINAYKDFPDLKRKLDKVMKTVSDDDREAISKIYQSLTKQEYADMHEGEIKHVHWIGRTFDHSPSVAALASLTSMQKEILTARADAIALIRSRVTGGEYSFNKIMPLAYGPEIANAGEEVKIEVLMVAFDSYKQPIITIDGGGGRLAGTKDGKGIVTAKASGGEINLKGTITIMNKSGVPSKKDWSHTVRVMKPEGTISLPQMNVLYRGYDNIVEGVASGYEETKLSGAGVTFRKQGKGYVCRVNGSGRTASITVSGYNKSTHKTQQLGTFSFRVSNLPPPQLYLGTLATGSTVPPSVLKSMTALFMKYPPEIPLNAAFDVGEWDISIPGARPVRGSGKLLPQEARDLLKQARSGSTVTISGRFRGPNSGFSSCVIRVQ